MSDRKRGSDGVTGVQSGVHFSGSKFLTRVSQFDNSGHEGTQDDVVLNIHDYDNVVASNTTII